MPRIRAQDQPSDRLLHSFFELYVILSSVIIYFFSGLLRLNFVPNLITRTQKKITSKMSIRRLFLCLPDSVTELVVGADLDISVTVSVRNEGDDSFNARILIPFPSSLSYRRVSLVEVKRCSVLHEGGSLCSGGISILLCMSRRATGRWGCHAQLQRTREC